MSTDGPYCIIVNNSQIPLMQISHMWGNSICTTIKKEVRTFPKLNYRVNEIPSKIPVSVLCRKWQQANPKINMEMQGSQNSQK